MMRADDNQELLARIDSLESLLAKATTFTIDLDCKNILWRNVRVEWRGPNDDGVATWCVTDGHTCYDANLEGQFEPINSSRTEEFKQRYRFTDLHEAISVAEKVLENWRSEVLAWRPDLKSPSPE